MDFEVVYLFVDESKERFKNKKSSFSLAGILVDSSKLFNIELELRRLKENNGIKYLKDLKNHSFKDKRQNITKKIVNILKNYNCLVLSAIIGSITLEEHTKNIESYKDASFFLMERFFLNLAYKKGLVIFDLFDEVKSQEKFRKMMYDLIMNTSMPKSSKKLKDRIYPCVFFGDDKYSEMLQVADLIVSSLHSAYWRLVKEGGLISMDDLPKYNPFLNLYWPLFVKSPKGTVEGYGIKLWL